MKQKLIKTTKISPWGTLEKFTIPDATLILEQIIERKIVPFSNEEGRDKNPTWN